MQCGRCLISLSVTLLLCVLRFICVIVYFSFCLLILIEFLCALHHYFESSDPLSSCNRPFIDCVVMCEQVLQLYQICNLNHGLMMVGPSGSGKTTAWKVLLKALERYEGTEGVAHVIDPKAISKEALYGVLDPNTREWTDGLFTHILR